MTNPRSAIIAVVDDEQRILESLQSLLESADYSVLLFSSAKALLESPQLADIDCLISDIDMPVMDGFELQRKLRAVQPTLPILLITGQPAMLNQVPSVDPGYHRVFKKPFDGQELLTAVGEVLRNPRQRTRPTT